MTTIFPENKHLFSGGNVKVTKFSSGAIITRVDSKLAMIKSYKLQLKVLGYIVDCGVIVKSNKPLISVINRQINRNDAAYNTNNKYSNAIQLLQVYIKGPKRMTKKLPLYKKSLEMLSNGGGTCPHTVILNRLFKNGKAQGLYNRLENLSNQ